MTNERRGYSAQSGLKLGINQNDGAWSKLGETNCPAPKMPNPSSPQKSLSEIAVDWCIHLQSEECSDADREEFRRWHDADPAHAEEYAVICRIWKISEQLPPSHFTQVLARPGRAGRVSFLGRAAAVLVAVGAFWGAGWSVGLLPDSVRYFAAEAAQRSVVLPDRSKVELNRNTELLYLGFIDQRQVALRDGEAYFDVQRNIDKPFVIHADNANVRVTGTHFNVWTAKERTTVTVTQGSVLVSRRDGSGSYNQTAELTAGMQAVLVPDRQLQLGRVDPSRDSAWRQGKLMLDDISLREALPLMNRYLDRPLRLVDTAAGELRIGGIYDTAELDVLVETLPRILPIRLSKTDEAILMSGRGRASGN